jgi:hypothetical protein
MFLDTCQFIAVQLQNIFRDTCGAVVLQYFSSCWGVQGALIGSQDRFTSMARVAGSKSILGGQNEKRPAGIPARRL